MNKPSPLIWSSASRTDVGKVREINEDACLDVPDVGLWAVADGMGGHDAGDLASHMIVQELQGIEPPHSLEHLIDQAIAHLNEVNSALRRESVRRDNQTIGSTVAVLVAFGTECACIWAGDSRVYRHRNGAMARLTEDHSLVEEYVEQGLLRREEAESSPQANVITRAVGVEDDLALDTAVYPMAAGDIFLLCSDGLYKELSEEEIAGYITRGSGDQQAITDSLTEAALARQARDNISAVVVRISDASGSAPEDITIPFQV